MRINPLYAAAGGAAVLLVLIIWSNSTINLSVQKGSILEPVALSPADVGAAAEPAKLSAPLASKAQQPGIYVQGEERDSWGDAHWEAYISRALTDANALSGAESQRTLEMIQKTPADFKRRLDSLNGRIKYFEDLKQKDPGNHEVKKKLENLYILKSTLVALEDKIVVPSSPAGN